MRTDALKLMFLILGLGATGANARISGYEKTGSLFKKAGIILKGEVVSIKDAPASMLLAPADPTTQYLAKINARPRAAEFRVDRVIKGDVAANTVDILFYELAGGGADAEPINLKQGEYLLVFLKEQGPGFSFMDLDHGKVPVPKSSGPKKAGKIEARAAMRDELLQMIRNPDPDVAGQGIQYLGELGEKEALVPELKKMRSSANSKLRKRSLVWLARSGDRESVKQFVAEMKDNKSDAGKLENVETLDSIGDSKDVETAPVLAELLTHPDKYVRRKSMESLRKLKNRKTLPQIATALDDSDEIVRYDALMAMCEMANTKPVGCPSTILFKASPDKYLSEWKAWWASHKDAGR